MMLSPCFHREKAKKLLKGSCCEKVSIKRGLDWMPWPLKHLMLLIGAALAFTRFLHFSTFHLTHKYVLASKQQYAQQEAEKHKQANASQQ